MHMLQNLLYPESRLYTVLSTLWVLGYCQCNSGEMKSGNQSYGLSLTAISI
jgi:hypothetical protein